MSKNDLVNKIDQLLPQTQCGLCTYGACRPYAEAIVFYDESIDKCPPGGARTLQAIAQLLEKDPSPLLAGMAAKEKAPSVALIKEDECIGCTKCIKACPVDAILGTSKKMHTVIATECTGCELCIEPCPVDCIEMLPLPPFKEHEQMAKADNARRRYQAKQERSFELSKEQEFATLQIQFQKEESIAVRKMAILEATQRVQAKRGLTE